MSSRHTRIIFAFLHARCAGAAMQLPGGACVEAPNCSRFTRDFDALVRCTAPAFRPRARQNACKYYVLAIFSVAPRQGRCSWSALRGRCGEVGSTPCPNPPRSPPFFCAIASRFLLLFALVRSARAADFVEGRQLVRSGFTFLSTSTERTSCMERVNESKACFLYFARPRQPPGRLRA